MLLSLALAILKNILCKKSATHLNTFAPLHTFVLAQIHKALSYEFEALLLLQHISFFKEEKG